MNRKPALRAAFALAPALLLSACASQTGKTAPVAPLVAAAPRQSLATADFLLLDRLTYGATRADIESYRSLGRAAWINRQLHPGAIEPLPPPAQQLVDEMTLSQKPIAPLVRSLEGRRREIDKMAAGEEREAAHKKWQEEMNGLSREAASRAMLRALYAPSQVREQMTWFWMNHFNVVQHKHLNRALMGDYEQHLRGAALGRFRDLLEQSARHAAMVSYLDNLQNAAGHINENYARELLELHTMGVDGGYTQRDVQELARVLTGLGFEPGDAGGREKDPARPLTVFRPARHEKGEKTILGTTIAPGGMDEIERVLDLLARQPATARHVSRQLARYWIGDEPSDRLVDELALEFRRSDGDIASVLGRLFSSPEFQASLGKSFKDPVHYVVSAVRLAYGDRVIRNPQPMLGWLNRMGEGLYNHNTPDGYPLQPVSWDGPGQLALRLEIARAIGSGSAGLFRDPGEGKGERPAFPQLSNPLYFEAIEPHLAPATREVLSQATSPQEWNQLLLSSPEFMVR